MSASAFSEFASTLDRAWVLRWNQCNEESYSLLLELKKTSAHIPINLRISLELLGNSFKRIRDNFAESKAGLGQIETLAQQQHIDNFHLHQERGLAHLVDGDFYCALESFNRAESLAVSPAFLAVALSNGLICRENLSLPCEQTKEKLKSALDKVPGTELIGVRDQLEAFDLRNALRDGKFSFISAKISSMNSNRLTQGRYLRLWSLALPYHKEYLPEFASEQKEWEFFSQNFRKLHLGSYRLRTLTGQLHPDDLRQRRLTETIDRIYLWVWRWLASPKLLPAKKILQVLAQIRVDEDHSKLTCDDRQMLKNSLLWLSLMGATPRTRIQPFIDLFCTATHESPLFEAESLLIEYLLALREGNDLLAQDLYEQCVQSRFSLANEDIIVFASIAKSVHEQNTDIAPLALKGFAATLIEFVVPKNVKNTTIAPFTVDMSTHTLHMSGTASNKSLSVCSIPVCRALKLLRATPVVSCSDFANFCFDVRHYDSFIHDRNIVNLLSRIKKIFGATLQFRMKAGNIIVNGNWNQISITGSNSALEQMSQEPAWQTFLNSAASERVDSASPHFVCDKTHDLLLDEPPFSLFGKTLKRREIETALSRPRSTVNRALNYWVKRGFITKNGNGRTTQYTFPIRLESKVARL